MQEEVPIPDLAPETNHHLETILLRFEEAWRGSSAPQVEEFLHDEHVPEKVLLEELIQIDLEMRLKSQSGTRVEDYLARYPEVAENEPFLISLLVSEFTIRRRYEANLSLAEYETRFPRLGERLANRLQNVLATLPAVPNYEIVGLLGRGGMGAVYLARQPKLNRLVAIKMVARNRTKSKTAVARFEREMQAVGKLDHPNLVRAIDAVSYQGQHYLVMEFIEGIDLEHVLRLHRRLSVPDAAEIARQVAAGLAHIHEHRLVHRDVKPSNVMLTPSGTVKLLDLGLARLHEDSTKHETTASEMLLGTVDYMSPEQAQDAHDVDIRADLYALGVTLYKLLTGITPFHHITRSSPVKRLLAIVMEPCPSVGTLRTDLPPPLTAIVDRLLAKLPHERLDSPQEVVAALVPFAVGNNLAALAAGDLQQILANPQSPTGEQHVEKMIPATATMAIATRMFIGLIVFLCIGLAWAFLPPKVVPLATMPPSEAINKTTPTASAFNIQIGKWKPSPQIALPNGVITQPAQLTGLNRWQIVANSPTQNSNVDLLVSPDGKYCAVRTFGPAKLDRYMIRIYAIKPEGWTLQRVIASTLDEECRCDWGPNSRQLAIYQKGLGLGIWNVESGQRERWLLHAAGDEDVEIAWSQDGEHLAVARDKGGLLFLHVSDAKIVREITAEPLLFPKNCKRTLAWIPQQQRVALSLTNDTVQLFSLDGTATQILQDSELKRPFHLAASPDGNWLAIAYEDTLRSKAGSANQEPHVRLWKSDGTPGPKLKSPDTVINGLAWSRNSKQLYVSGFNGSLWEANKAGEFTANSHAIFRSRKGEFIGDSPILAYYADDPFASLKLQDCQRWDASRDALPLRPWISQARFDSSNGMFGFLAMERVLWLRNSTGEFSRLGDTNDFRAVPITFDFSATGKSVAKYRRLEGEAWKLDTWNVDSRQPESSLRLESSKLPSVLDSRIEFLDSKHPLYVNSKSGIQVRVNPDNGQLQYMTGQPRQTLFWNARDKLVECELQAGILSISEQESGEVIQRADCPLKSAKHFSFAANHSDRILIVDPDDRLCLLDLRENKLLWQGTLTAGSEFRGWSDMPQLSPQGNRIVGAKGILDASTGKIVRPAFRFHYPLWLPDNRHVISINNGQYAVVSDCESLHDQIFVMAGESEFAEFDSAGNLLSGDIARIDQFYSAYLQYDDGTEEVVSVSDFYRQYENHERPLSHPAK